MRVFGVVKDGVTESAVAGARLRLCVGDRELASVHSDSNGEFEYREATSYMGETLVCEAVKEGYQRQKVVSEIDQEEVHLEIELMPEPSPEPPAKPPSQPGKTSRRTWPWIAIAVVVVFAVVALGYVMGTGKLGTRQLPNVKISEVEVSPSREGERLMAGEEALLRYTVLATALPATLTRMEIQATLRPVEGGESTPFGWSIEGADLATLKEAQRLPRRQSWTIPDDIIKNKPYAMLVEIDPDDNLEESVEDDNQGAAALVVRSRIPGPLPGTWLELVPWLRVEMIREDGVVELSKQDRRRLLERFMPRRGG
jgi:hypothetical protein